MSKKNSVLQAKLWDHFGIFVLRNAYGSSFASFFAEKFKWPVFHVKKFWPWIKNCDICYVNVENLIKKISFFF